MSLVFNCRVEELGHALKIHKTVIDFHIQVGPERTQVRSSKARRGTAREARGEILKSRCISQKD